MLENMAIKHHLPKRTLQISSFREGQIGPKDSSSDNLSSLLNMKKVIRAMNAVDPRDFGHPKAVAIGSGPGDIKTPYNKLIEGAKLISDSYHLIVQEYIPPTFLWYAGETLDRLPDRCRVAIFLAYTITKE